MVSRSTILGVTFISPSASATSRSLPRSAHFPMGRPVKLARFAGSGSASLAQMRQQDRQSRGGHAFDTPRLPERPRAYRLEARPRLVRETHDLRIIERRGNDDRFIAPESIDIRPLAVQIDRIFGFDFQLLADPARNHAEFRPDRAKPRKIDRRISQQIVSAAPDSIEIDLQPMAYRLARRYLERSREPVAQSSSVIFARKCRARSDPTQPRAMPLAVEPLIGIIGPQQQPIFGARSEHTVGFGNASRNQIVDHDAEIGFVPAEYDIRRARSAGSGIEPRDDALCRPPPRSPSCR